ncbi:MAG: neutral zinc metallopeptidase [Bacteroides sp.]|nr:neutral zinc metallopeptidase [Bacteroides sp.]MDE6823662.1 neutral zinc metallopeptidase [Duncaniella sp.]
MRLNGRRESSNISDRRGGGGPGLKIGGGITAVIIAAIIAWISGGNPLDVLTSNVGSIVGGGTQSEQTYTPTAEEEELARFSRQILAGTEDVWTKLFNEMGLEYEAPTLVLYNDAVQSACGNASASVGPFYCSADECLYIDLSFFRDMRKTLGADGDFAYAYVIAHEVGHHVQHLLGTLDKAHAAMNRTDKTEANNISVRIELQADFLAGVWAHHDNAMFNSLEPGDIEEALDASRKIGDDYLQKRAQGYSVPDSFTHGTSEQRSRWLRKGLSTGDIRQGDTFSPPYASL